MLSDRWGGAERLFLELCEGLALAGCEVLAVCRAGFARGEALRSTRGIEYVEVPALGNWDLLSSRRIRAAAAAFRPALVHGHLARGTWMAGRAGRSLGIPVVTTTHNRIKAKYFRRVDWFTTINRGLSAYLEGCGVAPSRIRPIPNFSLLPAADGPADGHASPVFVSLGRFVRKKGFPVLVEAFASWLAEGGDGRLLLGGTGPEEEAVRARVRELGIADRVELAGWVEDTAAFLRRGNVFVLPSLDEPFGIVLLEAMACGRPIVATRTGGPLDVLDGSTAWFAEPGDAAGLCRAMGEAAADGAGREAKAARALELYRSRYTRDAVLPLYLDLYREVAGLPAGTAGEEGPERPAGERGGDG
jgi:glycosyltransferase involved in cell wall biosynthesis